MQRHSDELGRAIQWPVRLERFRVVVNSTTAV